LPVSIDDISIFDRYCYVCGCVDFTTPRPKGLPGDLEPGTGVGAGCTRCGHSEVVHAPRTLGPLRKPLIRLGNTPPILNWFIVVTLPLALVVLTGAVLPQLPPIVREVLAIFAVCCASPLFVTVVYYAVKSIVYAIILLIVAGIVAWLVWIAGRSFHLW
jgi:hypothetical protein